MWIERLVEPLLRQRAATRPCVVLTGARQTGKTSLMRRLFPDHAFVTLDLPSEAEQAELDPGSFLARHPPPLIVDEIQYAPGLFRHLKTAIDADRRQNGAYLLTGSQPMTLMRSVTESLAGRAAVIELEALSYAEVKAACPDIAVEEFLVRGAFPSSTRTARSTPAATFSRTSPPTSNGICANCSTWRACATSSAFCERPRCAPDSC